MRDLLRLLITVACTRNKGRYKVGKTKNLREYSHKPYFFYINFMGAK